MELFRIRVVSDQEIFVDTETYTNCNLPKKIRKALQKYSNNSENVLSTTVRLWLANNPAPKV